METAGASASPTKRCCTRDPGSASARLAPPTAVTMNELQHHLVGSTQVLTKCSKPKEARLGAMGSLANWLPPATAGARSCARATACVRPALPFLRSNTECMMWLVVLLPLALLRVCAAAAPVPLCSAQIPQLEVVNTTLAQCSLSLPTNDSHAPWPSQGFAVCSCKAAIHDLAPLPDCVVQVDDTPVQLDKYLQHVFAGCRDANRTTESTHSDHANEASVTSRRNRTIGFCVGFGAAAIVLVVIIAVVWLRRRKRQSAAVQYSNRSQDPCLDTLERSWKLDLSSPISLGGRQTEESGVLSPYHQLVSPTCRYSTWDAEAPVLWEDPDVTAVQLRANKLRLGAHLGRGSFAEVFRGVFNGQEVVIKRLPMDRCRIVYEMDEFLMAIKLMATYQHEHIVRFIGATRESFTDLCAVSEFMDGGDLRSMLDSWQRNYPPKPRGMDEIKITIAWQVIDALTYLHELQPRLFHGALTSRNVLLSATLDAKLKDIGVSVRKRQAHRAALDGVTSLWVAPELMKLQQFDEKVDIFAFGVLLSELDGHQLPYAHVAGATEPEICELVANGKATIELSSECPERITKLALQCVHMDPAMRPSAREVRNVLEQVLDGFRRDAYE